MNARPSSTRDNLIHAAMRLMLLKGFHATSVEEICAEAGVTKGGFFHHFHTKEEIAGAALAFFLAEKLQRFRDAVFPQTADSLERIHLRLDLIGGLAEGSEIERNCLIGNLSQEVWSTNPELRQACRQAFETVIAEFGADLEQARRKYSPAIDFDPASVSRFFVTILEGTFVLSKAIGDPDILPRNIEHFRAYLVSLFGLPRT